MSYLNANRDISIRTYNNSENLYRFLATHSIGEKARSFSYEEKAQYALKNILGFNKEA